MQAIVVSIPVSPGQQVAEGDLLIVIEAMKMEKYIHSTAAGTVEEILVETAQNVPAGTPLLKINLNQEGVGDTEENPANSKETAGQEA